MWVRPSHAHISSTKTHRPIVAIAMESYVKDGIADPVAAFRSPQMPAWGDIVVSFVEKYVQLLIQSPV